MESPLDVMDKDSMVYEKSVVCLSYGKSMGSITKALASPINPLLNF